MSFIFLTTLQPYLRQCAGPSRGTSLLVGAERKAWADAVASRRAGFVPLCIDHADGEKQPPSDRPFEVPGELQIGRLIDVMVRPNGHLLGVCEIFHERPETRRIAADIRAGKRWGSSLCTNLTTNADESEVLSKRITHIGITQDPQWGTNDPEVGGDTWIHLVAESPQGFYTKLKELYLDQEPGAYVPMEMRMRMVEMRAEWDRAAATPAPVDTRQLASDSTARLHAPATATPRAPLPSPSSALIMADSSAITPMEGIVATGAAAAAPATAATSSAPAPAAAPAFDTGRIPTIQRATADFMRRISDPAMPDRIQIDLDAVRMAEELAKEWGSVVRHLESDAWPEDAFKSLVTLQEYIKKAKNETKEWATGFYGADGMTERMKDALLNPTAPQNLEPARQLYATRNKGMASQADFERRLLEKQTELAVANKKAAEVEESLKRTREERDKERADFERRLNQLEQSASTRIGGASDPVVPPAKRARSDEPAAAAAAATTAAAETKLVDVTATRATGGAAGYVRPSMQGLPNVRELTGKFARVNELVEGNRFNPFEMNTITSGVLTPWENPDKPLHKRILELANGAMS